MSDGHETGALETHLDAKKPECGTYPASESSIPIVPPTYITNTRAESSLDDIAEWNQRSRGAWTSWMDCCSMYVATKRSRREVYADGRNETQVQVHRLLWGSFRIHFALDAAVLCADT